MSALSLLGLAQVSGTLVLDSQGKLTILPEGVDPRPGDVVIDVLENDEVGDELRVELIQPDGASQPLSIPGPAVDPAQIIAQIEAGQDPTQDDSQAPAAGESDGSSPTTTGSIQRDGSQILAATQFDTSGLETQGLSATQSLTLLQFLNQPEDVPPVIGPVVVNLSGPGNLVEGTISDDFVVTLSSPAPVGSIVTLNYSYSSASEADIVETREAIVGLDGTTATFTISPVDDKLAESDEAFTVSVADIITPDGSSVFEQLELTDASQQVIISDEDTPGPEDTVTVTLEGPESIVEGDTSTTYTVTLSSAAPVGSVVTLSYTDGTATAGEDYTKTLTAIVGGDGTTATFTVDTLDDNLVEGSESFTVSVSGVEDGEGNAVFEALNLDGASQLTNITDEDTPGPEDTVTVTLEGPESIVEGDTSTTYTVTLSSAAPIGSVVTLSYTDGTATAGEDYTKTLTAIVGGDGTTATFTIDTLDDNLAEGSESFTVSVSGVEDGDGNAIFEALNLDGASQQTNITDEGDPDPEDTVTVTLEGPENIVEGDTSSTYTVTLSSAAPVGSVVTLSYADGTATAGEDYAKTLTAIVGGDGTTATFTVDTLDDNLVEGSESFTVSVSGVEDGEGNAVFEALNLDGASLLTHITDEDTPGPEDTVTVTLEGPESIVEGDTSTTYTVKLGSAAPIGSVVTLSYTDGTATAGEDYTKTLTAIVGGDGTTATFTVDTLDDNLVEGSESFTVSVSGIEDGEGNAIFEALNLDGASQLTHITDEDTPGPEDSVKVTLQGPDYVTEGQQTGIYTVSLSEQVPENSVITLSYSYTTASNEDIVETTQAVVGPDGVTATFTIDTVDDVLSEGDEKFSVSVSGVTTSAGAPIFEALDLSEATQETTIVDFGDTPPEVTSFEYFASEDTIPIDFSDFITDLEDDQSADKDTFIKIENEPAYGQLYFISGSGQRFDLDEGDMIEDTYDIYYELDVAFDATVDGFTGDLNELLEQGIELTGGTYTGTTPHDNLTVEEIGFDGSGVLKQRGYFTKRFDESGQGKETESAEKEYMSVKFNGGLVTSLTVGTGAMTGSFNNGDSLILIYLYRDGVLVDEDPVIMDGSKFVPSEKQAEILVNSTEPFDEIRIIAVDETDQNAGFVLQSIDIHEAQVNDQFEYSAVDSDGNPSDESAIVDVNILTNGNLDTTDDVDFAVQGGNGVTVIHGTDGDDLLIGGLGDDVMTGGLGNDSFKWVEADLDGGFDVITDFSQQAGNSDLIDFSDLFDETDTLENLLDSNIIDVSEQNGNTYINVDKGEGRTVTIELEGVTGVTNDVLNSIIVIHDT
ncbi:Calx-beta domain-containing protein [Vibrio mediterranei]|uniref:Calx-beta domain-containing protein n=2 Tax=Vibrio mediterranei TaxID=689 RepID=UPI004067C4B4